MAKIQDITGQKFRHLTALRFVGKSPSHKAIWEFHCELCNSVTQKIANSVKSGKVSACGCQQFAGHRRTHGKRETYEYGVWKGMRQRCNDTNAESYHNYGGRGIKVCERWNDFAAFLADVGLAPSEKHTIDRIDNNGHYEPGNVVWATRAQQRRNSRQLHLITYQDRTMCLKDWAAVLGVKYTTLYHRVFRSKMPIDQAFAF